MVFQKGWKGGPGRPRKEAKLSYLDTLAREMTDEKWLGIIRMAIDDATHENPKIRIPTREWLAKQLIGDRPIDLADMLDQFEELKRALGHGDQPAIECLEANPIGDVVPVGSGETNGTASVGEHQERPVIPDDIGGQAAGPVAENATPIFS